MADAFCEIVAGQAPAHVVHGDEKTLAFLSTAPITAGHTLIVPREHVDEWLEADVDLQNHCMVVARAVGTAVKAAFAAPRAGLVIAGFEIPHLHLHVFPAWSMPEFDFNRANPASAAQLGPVAFRLRRAIGDGTVRGYSISEEEA